MSLKDKACSQPFRHTRSRTACMTMRLECRPTQRVACRRYADHLTFQVERMCLEGSYRPVATFRSLVRESCVVIFMRVVNRDACSGGGKVSRTEMHVAGRYRRSSRVGGSATARQGGGDVVVSDIIVCRDDLRRQLQKSWPLGSKSESNGELGQMAS